MEVFGQTGLISDACEHVGGAGLDGPSSGSEVSKGEFFLRGIQKDDFVVFVDGLQTFVLGIFGKEFTSEDDLLALKLTDGFTADATRLAVDPLVFVPDDALGAGLIDDHDGVDGVWIRHKNLHRLSIL